HLGLLLRGRRERGAPRARLHVPAHVPRDRHPPPVHPRLTPAHHLPLMHLAQVHDLAPVPAGAHPPEPVHRGLVTHPLLRHPVLPGEQATGQHRLPVRVLRPVDVAIPAHGLFQPMAWVTRRYSCGACSSAALISPSWSWIDCCSAALSLSAFSLLRSLASSARTSALISGASGSATGAPLPWPPPLSNPITSARVVSIRDRRSSVLPSWPGSAGASGSLVSGSVAIAPQLPFRGGVVEQGDHGRDVRHQRREGRFDLQQLEVDQGQGRVNFRAAHVCPHLLHSHENSTGNPIVRATPHRRGVDARAPAPPPPT